MKNIQLTIAATAIFLFSCSKEPKNVNPLGEPDIIAVKIANVTSLAVPGSVTATGFVSTEDQTNYSFKTGGVISGVMVNEGAFFRKGQLLATINSTELSSGVAQSSLGVEKAQRDYDRAKSLYKDSVFTLEQLQNTKTALDLSKKVKEAVAFNEGYTKIYASSDGFVVKKIGSEGEIIGAGMPILLTNAVNNGNGYVLKVGVTDLEWAVIKIGQVATVRLDGYPNQQFAATVFRKQQSADREIGSFQIELKLQLKNLEPPIGMFGKAEIFTNKQDNAIAIPYAALVEADGSKGFIFSTDGKNKIRKVQVNIAKIENDHVFITDKLEGINQIVVSNSAFLNEKSLIKIIK